MQANCFQAYNLPSLTDIRVYDNSDYTGGSVLDVTATRLMWATVNSINTIQTNVTAIIAFKEYVVISGSVVINGVTYNAGSTIYLANDTNIVGSAVVNETGYYGIRSTYVPTTDYVSYTPSQAQYNQTGLYFQDNVFTLIYTLFTTQYSAGSVTIASSTQFIVNGTQGDYITIGGESYYVGEVFTKSTTFTFANGSGTNTISAFQSDVTKNFRTWYYNWTLWGQYFNRISTSYEQSNTFLARFDNVTARINQCGMYENQQFNVSLQGVQDLMDDISENYQL